MEELISFNELLSTKRQRRYEIWLNLKKLHLLDQD